MHIIQYVKLYMYNVHNIQYTIQNTHEILHMPRYRYTLFDSLVRFFSIYLCYQQANS